MLEKLKEDAFEKTEGLDPVTLRDDYGIHILITYLRAKYEPKEAIKIGTALDDFMETLHRKQGEEIQDFDTRFESKIKELERTIGLVNPSSRHIGSSKSSTYQARRSPR